MSETKLSAALLGAQKEIKAVGKDATNSFHRYSYVSGDGMVEAARDALHKHGLTVTGSKENGLDLMTDPPLASIGYVLRHESGEQCEFHYIMPVIQEKGRPLDKALLGARTTCLSYFLRDLLLIPRVDEDEIERRNDLAKEPVAVAPAKPVEPLGDWGTEIVNKIISLGVEEAALRQTIKKAGTDLGDKEPSEWPGTIRVRLEKLVATLEKKANANNA